MEVTIEITQYCPYNCDYCSSNAGPLGKHLEKTKIFTFLKAQQDIERINISGGEPLSHPDFYEILTFCYSLTENVWIYSNMIKQLIYNSDIIEEIKVEANVPIVPGRKVYIPKNTSRTHLLKLVHQGRAKDLPKGNITVSNNFFQKNCQCYHTLLQADGQVVPSPCKKRVCGEKN